MMRKGLTIITPTYNREKLLVNAWKSLQAQNSVDFIWLIVDDGSIDNTRQQVNEFAANSEFEVIYIYQENGGKHRAINTGVKLCETEHVCILDSDDKMTATFIESVCGYINDYQYHPNLGGIVGRICSEKGEIYGKELNRILITDIIDYRYNLKIGGDHFEIFKTNVMLYNPFPEIEGEKFVPESLAWNRIGTQYDLLFVPDVFQIREYLVGGLTDNIIKIRMKSPMAAMLTYSELNAYDIPWKEKIKSALNFWRFSFNSGSSLREKVKMIGPFNLWLFPLGFFLYVKDLLNIR